MHIPVLLAEVIAGLDLASDDIVLDGTLGGGGHARAICRILGREGLYIGLDADAAAVARVRDQFKNDPPLCRYHLFELNFRFVHQALSEIGVLHVRRALFDLGLSSYQLDAPGRGFSFMRDEPLDMRFAQNNVGGATLDEPLSAAEIVNEWDESSIADILYYYGDERHARRIAREIVITRAVSPIRTTHELVAVIERAVPVRFRERRHHPATKTFQALRITVNDEITALREGLEAVYAHLSPGGRLAVISFHSIEDRIVKQFMRTAANTGKSAARILTKKPIIPTDEERNANPRARSAKLRILELTAS